MSACTQVAKLIDHQWAAFDRRWNGRGNRPATLRIKSGVGDDAYSVAGSGVVTLSVKKGAAFIIIFVQVPNASPEQTKALERKVALKLVEKL